jgi:hypothetical protein
MEYYNIGVSQLDKATDYRQSFEAATLAATTATAAFTAAQASATLWQPEPLDLAPEPVTAEDVRNEARRILRKYAGYHPERVTLSDEALASRAIARTAGTQRNVAHICAHFLGVKS